MADLSTNDGTEKPIGGSLKRKAEEQEDNNAKDPAGPPTKIAPVLSDSSSISKQSTTNIEHEPAPEKTKGDVRLSTEDSSKITVNQSPEASQTQPGPTVSVDEEREKMQ